MFRSPGFVPYREAGLACYIQSAETRHERTSDHQHDRDIVAAATNRAKQQGLTIEDCVAFLLVLMKLYGRPFLGLTLSASPRALAKSPIAAAMNEGSSLSSAASR